MICWQLLHTCLPVWDLYDLLLTLIHVLPGGICTICMIYTCLLGGICTICTMYGVFSGWDHCDLQ